MTKSKKTEHDELMEKAAEELATATSLEEKSPIDQADMAAQDDPEDQPEQGACKMKVNYAGGLNFRREPKKGNNVIKVLKHGTEIIVVDIVDGWAETTVGKNHGFAMAEFLEEV